MAQWHPPEQNPEVPAWFSTALHEIDPTMRVVWGMQRYFRAEWAIERKIDPIRYAKMYSSVFEDGGPRFVDQPIYDNSQPIYDEVIPDMLIGYKQVGVNKYDLAPEYEWIAFRPTLDQALLDLIKELLWRHDHPEEALKIDQAATDARNESKHQNILDAGMEGVDEAFLETGKKVQFGYGKTRREAKQ